jgi:hypothetical protein
MEDAETTHKVRFLYAEACCELGIARCRADADHDEDFKTALKVWRRSLSFIPVFNPSNSSRRCYTWKPSFFFFFLVDCVVDWNV